MPVISLLISLLYAISDDKSYYQVGTTALNLANQCGHIEVVRLLLDHNANMEAAAMVSQSVWIASTYCISLHVGLHWTY